MARTIPPRWSMILTMTLLLVIPLARSLADDEAAKAAKDTPRQEAEGAEAESKDAAPPASLRVEDGRVMTNRGAARTAPKERVALRDGMVITNDLLERIVGPLDQPAPGGNDAPAGVPPGSPAPPPPAAADPLSAMADERAAAASRDRRLEQAEKDLQAARAKLANLETQLLATRNPFAKRPELSDEEKEYRRVSGETAVERAERTQKLVDAAREEVRAAEELVSDLRSGS